MSRASRGEYWFGDAPYIADAEKKRLLARKRRRAALARARTRKANAAAKAAESAS
jgi:hypothetical protein